MTEPWTPPQPEVQKIRVIRRTLLTGAPLRRQPWMALTISLLVIGLTFYHWHLLTSQTPVEPPTLRIPEISKPVDLPVDPVASRGDRIFEHGEYWRVFTAQAAHGDLKHLLSNLLLFYIFGYFLYGYYGFFVFPLSVIFLGAFTNLLATWSYPPKLELIGASGCVYVMAAIWLVLYLLVEKVVSLRGRLLRILGVALALMMPATFEPSTSYRTHLFGFLIGVVFALGFYFMRRKYLRSFDYFEDIEVGEAL